MFLRFLAVLPIATIVTAMDTDSANPVPDAGAMVALMLLAHPARSECQDRTDLVVLANGDRITGEVRGLSRGRLELDTDSAGTIHLEWADVRGSPRRRSWKS